MDAEEAEAEEEAPPEEDVDVEEEDDEAEDEDKEEEEEDNDEAEGAAAVLPTFFLDDTFNRLPHPFLFLLDSGSDFFFSALGRRGTSAACHRGSCDRSVPSSPCSSLRLAFV